MVEATKLKHGFVKTPLVVLMDRRISAGDREVYTWLVHMSRIFKKVYPSQDYLEEVTGLSVPSIRRHLHNLKAVGLIKTAKSGFSGNNIYTIVPLEEVYSSNQLETSNRLPKKGETHPVGRTRSGKKLEEWWETLDPIRRSVGAKLLAERNRIFNHDSREARRLKQVLYTATAWFEPGILNGPWNEFPKEDLMRVAKHPITIVTKPGDRVTIEDVDQSVVALAPDVEVVRGETGYRFEDSGLIVVRSGTEPRLVNISSALDRLANI